jgi:hypothetical protein
MAYLKRKSRNTEEQKDENTCSNNMSVVEHAESPSGDKSFINKARGRRSRNSPQFRDSSAPRWILLGHHQYGFLAKTRRLASMALLRVALDSGYLKGRTLFFSCKLVGGYFPIVPSYLAHVLRNCSICLSRGINRLPSQKCEFTLNNLFTHPAHDCCLHINPGNCFPTNASEDLNTLQHPRCRQR